MYRGDGILVAIVVRVLTHPRSKKASFVSQLRSCRLRALVVEGGHSGPKPCMVRSVRVLAAVPSYDEFRVGTTDSREREYLESNIPVLLPAAMTESWQARHRYCVQGAMDWDALARDYGHHEVPVIIGTAERTVMLLREAVAMIPTSPVPVYIKDWHLVRTSRHDLCKPTAFSLPYVTPNLFADDCTLLLLMTGMNNVTPHAAPTPTYTNYSDAWLVSTSEAYERDDFRFCYAGTKGSCTPLHRDGAYYT